MSVWTTVNIYCAPYRYKANMKSGCKVAVWGLVSPHPQLMTAWLRALSLRTSSPSNQDPPLDVRVPLRLLGRGGSLFTERTPPTGNTAALALQQILRLITTICSKSRALSSKCVVYSASTQTRVLKRITHENTDSSLMSSFLALFGFLWVGEFTNSRRLRPNPPWGTLSGLL